MQASQERSERAAVGPDAPVKHGSPLYRILELVAREIARDLAERPATPPAAETK